MGFQLLPPAGSGLALSLAVDLPRPRTWDLSSARIREATVVLSGATSVSSWPKSITNARPVYEQTITEAMYLRLDALDRHATQTSWTLVADGRTFLVEIDVTRAEQIFRAGQPYRSVAMFVQILEEK